MTEEEANKKGVVRCRECRWCRFDREYDGEGHCKKSQDPDEDRVFLDEAGCEYGEY